MSSTEKMEHQRGTRRRSRCRAVFPVMTAPARLEAVIASLTTATNENVGSEHVETLEAYGQVTGKNCVSIKLPIASVYLLTRVRHHASECDLET